MKKRATHTHTHTHTHTIKRLQKTSEEKKPPKIRLSSFPVPIYCWDFSLSVVCIPRFHWGETIFFVIVRMFKIIIYLREPNPKLNIFIKFLPSGFRSYMEEIENCKSQRNWMTPKKLSSAYNRTAIHVISQRW